jgi:hypothetical protein
MADERLQRRRNQRPCLTLAMENGGSDQGHLITVTVFDGVQQWWQDNSSKDVI